MEKSIDTKKLTQILDSILKTLGYNLLKDQDMAFLKENLQVRMIESSITRVMVYEYSINNEFILKWFISEEGNFEYFTPYFKEIERIASPQLPADVSTKNILVDEKNPVFSLVSEGLDNLRNKLSAQLTEINSTLKLMEKRK